MNSYIVKGDFCYSEAKNKLKAVKNGYLVVENGTIKGLYQSICDEYKDLAVKDYTGKLIIPGLSDLHIHAPQYQFRGLWMDMELLEWLEKHTFPEEAKYKDMSYADIAYSIFTSDLLKTPTTRLSVFSSMHKNSTLLLMKKLSEAGFHGFVGKVNMDRNSPDYLREETSQSIEDTLSFLEECSSIDNIKPIITPRFIPSCSDFLLHELGKISIEHNLPVQSHLSENLSEIEWVKELVPDAKCYADAYNIFNLWGKMPTIMAHCTWSDKFDDDYMDKKNIFIAHCPDSNTNLTSGVAAARYFLYKGGANIGLGTDIAAGSSPYLTRSITDAIHASKLRTRLSSDKDATLTFAESFYMASIGGGRFFGKVGSFEPGYDADFSVLDESSLDSTLENEFSIEERLERYCYLASERPVLHKTIKGKELF